MADHRGLLADMSRTWKEKYGFAPTFTEDMIKGGLLQIALTAKADRDRTRALELLGKIKGMMVDRVETVDARSNEQILDDIGKQFGEVARKNAEKQLG